jgi:hypothetical protein
VLDDVERRALLVDPAGEDSPERALAIGGIDLDEGPGELLGLVRRGRLAGAQPDDDVVVAHRLARPQGDVAGDSVAFVDEADHRDSLRHRSRTGGERVGGSAYRLRLDLAVGHLVLPAPAARGERGQAGECGGGEEKPAHGAYSGVQAW